jgi:hypothetical protein
MTERGNQMIQMIVCALWSSFNDDDNLKKEGLFMIKNLWKMSYNHIQIDERSDQD